MICVPGCGLPVVFPQWGHCFYFSIALILLVRWCEWHKTCKKANATYPSRFCSRTVRGRGAWEKDEFRLTWKLADEDDDGASYQHWLLLHVVVVECPTFQYLDSLVSNSHLLKYTSSQISEDELEPCLIVHLTPAAVMASDAYQSWMSQSVTLSSLSCDLQNLGSKA